MEVNELIDCLHSETGYSRLHLQRTLGALSDIYRVPVQDSHERYHVQHVESFERAAATISYGESDWRLPVNRNSRTSVEVARLTQMMHEVQMRLNSLEQRTGTTSTNGALSEDFTPGSEVSDLLDDNTCTEQVPDVVSKEVEVIAELQEVSWQNFMNRYSCDATLAAIEVLMHGQSDYCDMETEKARPEEIQTNDDRVRNTRSSVSPSVDGISQLPDRIRINSPHILNVLASISHSINTSAPVVMLRPFKFLIHFEEQIRKSLPPSQQLSSDSETVAALDSTINDDAAHDNLAKVKHMECLIGFIDKHITPSVTRLKNDFTSKIAFRDLWLIFQPGVDIYMPVKNYQHSTFIDPTTMTPEMIQGRYERLWRIIGVGGGRQNFSANQERETPLQENAFKIHCYYVDYDGTYFGPTIHTFSIQPFSGEQDITSLDFFPLRFLPQRDVIQSRSFTQGQLVFDALLQSHNHFFYSGPTLITQPCGCSLQSPSLHQEHVESEVIIDYRVALQRHPSWRPQPTFWKLPPRCPGEVEEKSEIRYWEDETESKLVRTESIVIFDDNLVDIDMAKLFKGKARIFDPVPSGWVSNENCVPNDQVPLLSPRVFAFVLRTRSFAPIWLGGLQKISAQMDGLNNLQLRDNTSKDTIHALVRTHYLQMRFANSDPAREYDLVRGKGKGLVFLLHGAPGVGKTLTAESVAAANGRPLFQITCGDLGLTPNEVEFALQEIFRYAQLWNCVLLLDECDIFLTQRTKADLTRNSLVSVFLRMLEWYTGVLFLTTNRVGTLDNAVKSRVTWSTYYPPLDLRQTKEIWKTHLRLLGTRHPNVEADEKGILKFAKGHFNDHVERGTNWNGRQIQNAFKVAVSLADWATFSGGNHQALNTDIAIEERAHQLKLTASHFQQVAAAVEVFDDYLYEATGQTEADRAFNALERADNYPYREEVHEETGSGMSQEPSTGDRRSSSMTAASYAQLQGSHLSQRPIGGSSARRASHSQSVQPPSRRPSILQQTAGAPPQEWSNGGPNGMYHGHPTSVGLPMSPVQLYGPNGFTPTTGHEWVGGGHHAPNFNVQTGWGVPRGPQTDFGIDSFR